MSADAIIILVFTAGSWRRLHARISISWRLICSRPTLPLRLRTVSGKVVHANSQKKKVLGVAKLHCSGPEWPSSRVQESRICIVLPV